MKPITTSDLSPGVQLAAARTKALLRSDIRKRLAANPVTSALPAEQLDASAFLQSVDLGQIGTDMVNGLAAGITGAAGAVIDAITGVVGGAVDSAKSLLRINSPSKVFADIGGSTGEGLVQGVEAATSDVQDAFAAMVEPPDVPASALEAQDTPWGASVAPSVAAGRGAQVSDTGPSGDAAAKGGKSIDFSGATFQFYGVKEDGSNLRLMIEETFTDILEGAAMSIAGAGPREEPA